MRINLLYIFTILYWFNSNSQTPNLSWAKQFGGSTSNYNWNDASRIKTDQGGNVYSTGLFMGNVDFDPGPGTYSLNPGTYCYISKLDASGNFVWVKAIGTGALTISRGMAIDASGNIYIAGLFNGTGDFDPGVNTFSLSSIGVNDGFIIKLSNSGNFIWAKQFEGGNFVHVNSISVDNAKNVYTTGNFENFGDFDPGVGVYTLTTNASVYRDAFISKLDSLGNFIWAKQIKGNSYTFSNYIFSDTAGNTCIAGLFDSTTDFDPGPAAYTLTPSGSYDGYIAKLNSSGNFVFAKKLDSKGWDEIRSVAIDGTGNIYYTGVFSDTCDFDPSITTFTMAPFGGQDIFISKMNASGNFMWAKKLGGISDDIPFDISLDVNSNVYTTGSFRSVADFDPGPGIFNLTCNSFSGPYNTDVFISKLDMNGNFSWAIQFGDTSADVGRSIYVDLNSNIYTTGNFGSDTLDFDPVGTFTMSPINKYDFFVHKMCQGCLSGISENQASSFKIYPNPSKNSLNLALNSEFVGGHIQLYDAFGKLILNESIQNKEVRIELSLNSGIYFIKAITKYGVTKTEKLVIE